MSYDLPSMILSRKDTTSMSLSLEDLRRPKSFREIIALEGSSTYILIPERVFLPDLGSSPRF